MGSGNVPAPRPGEKPPKAESGSFGSIHVQAQERYLLPRSSEVWPCLPGARPGTLLLSSVPSVGVDGRWWGVR